MKPLTDKHNWCQFHCRVFFMSFTVIIWYPDRHKWWEVRFAELEASDFLLNETIHFVQTVHKFPNCNHNQYTSTHFCGSCGNNSSECINTIYWYMSLWKCVEGRGPFTKVISFLVYPTLFKFPVLLYKPRKKCECPCNRKVPNWIFFPNKGLASVYKKTKSWTLILFE